jgi:hypothetical protein
MAAAQRQDSESEALEDVDSDLASLAGGMAIAVGLLKILGKALDTQQATDRGVEQN